VQTMLGSQEVKKVCMGRAFLPRSVGSLQRLTAV
jgi:hypothetical protein